MQRSTGNLVLLATRLHLSQVRRHTMHKTNARIKITAFGPFMFVTA